MIQLIINSCIFIILANCHLKSGQTKDNRTGEYIFFPSILFDELLFLVEAVGGSTIIQIIGYFQPELL